MDHSSSSSLKGVLVLIAAISGIALVIFIYSSRWGISVSPDSTVYISAARNLLEGRGFLVHTEADSARPLTGYPPMYPLLLALSGIFGTDPLEGARWLHAILFVGNIFCTGLIAWLLSGSWPVTMLAGLLMLSSVDLLNIHIHAWSESSYLLWTMAGLLFLWKYNCTPRLRFLVWSSAFLGLAFLTRYAGISGILTGIFVLMCGSCESANVRKKIRETVIFTVLSCTPMLIWVVRNKFQAGELTSRSIHLNPITWTHIELGLNTMATWLAPWGMEDSRASAAVMIIFVALTVFIIGKAARNSGKRPAAFLKEQSSPLQQILIHFIVAYLLVIVLSTITVEASMPFGYRILAPVFVLVMVLVLNLYHVCLPWITLPLPIRLTHLLSASILTLYFFTAAQWVMAMHEGGKGYTDRRWRESQLIHAIKPLPPDLAIVTNAPDILYILSNRKGRMLPAKLNATTGMVQTNYSAELVRLKETLQGRQGLIVYFHNIWWRYYLPSEEELHQQLPLELIQAFPDGNVYSIR